LIYYLKQPLSQAIALPLALQDTLSQVIAISQVSRTTIHCNHCQPKLPAAHSIETGCLQNFLLKGLTALCCLGITNIFSRNQRRELRLPMQGANPSSKNRKVSNLPNLDSIFAKDASNKLPTNKILPKHHKLKASYFESKNQEEPRTKNQEPRTKNQEPRTKNQEETQRKTARSSTRPSSWISETLPLSRKKSRYVLKEEPAPIEQQQPRILQRTSFHFTSLSVLTIRLSKASSLAHRCCAQIPQLLCSCSWLCSV
jgi:hypothetical protein